MLYLSEAFERLAAHPLGRRIRRLQLRVLSLERLELTEEGVVGIVADLRIVENVVAVVVTLKLAPQPGGR